MVLKDERKDKLKETHDYDLLLEEML